MKEIPIAIALIIIIAIIYLVIILFSSDKQKEEKQFDSVHYICQYNDRATMPIQVVEMIDMKGRESKLNIPNYRVIWSRYNHDINLIQYWYISEEK